MNEALKPQIEHSYGIVLKGYCGACGRMLFCRGKYMTMEDVKEKKACQWCGRKIDWTGVKERETDGD